MMFFIISCGLLFYFFTLSKDDAQPFLGYVLSNKFFRIRFSSASRAHTSQEGLWWTEGSCSRVSITTRVVNKRRNARARESISEV